MEFLELLFGLTVNCVILINTTDIQNTNYLNSIETSKKKKSALV